MRSLERLYLSQLCEMRDAEVQFLDVAPKLRGAATAESLRAVLASHERGAHVRLRRIEVLLERAGTCDEHRRCCAMEGLIEEVMRTLGAEGDPRVRDAAIIGAVQKLDHYEIAAYGCLSAWAGSLGRGSDDEVLRASLREEWDADDLLSRIAEAWINGAAGAG